MKFSIELPEIEGHAWCSCSHDQYREAQIFNSDKTAAVIFGRSDRKYYIAKSTAKKYDWTKTGSEVAVYDDNGYVGLFKGLGRFSSQLVPNFWQVHHGGECPVDLQAALVEVMYRDSLKEHQTGRGLGWQHTGGPDDIIAWRFVRLADGYKW